MKKDEKQDVAQQLVHKLLEQRFRSALTFSQVNDNLFYYNEDQVVNGYQADNGELKFIENGKNIDITDKFETNFDIEKLIGKCKKKKNDIRAD